MLVTSDKAKTILKKLSEEKELLINDLRKSATFVAAITENVEEVRPEFDLEDTINKIKEIDLKMMTIRHERNIFNSTSIINGIGLTVDAALVRIAELSELSKMLSGLTRNKEKERFRLGISSTKEIEYTYINYDLETAKKIYDDVESERRELLNRLDFHNATVTFEVTF